MLYAYGIPTLPNQTLQPLTRDRMVAPVLILCDNLKIGRRENRPPRPLLSLFAMIPGTVVCSVEMGSKQAETTPMVGKYQPLETETTS